jgi:3-isopropylmalate/(R)-2-methylmalate dehydratase small subunit
MGLFILECSDTDKIEEGDELKVDFSTGAITMVRTNETMNANPVPPFMQSLVRAGGLMAYVKQRMESAAV